MFILAQDIDFPDFTEAELKEQALKFQCRVELFHSNVCYGVEQSWPKRLFGRPSYQDLLPHQKSKLIRQMSRNGMKLYRKYVNEDRLKRRLQLQTNRTLAEYNEERYLRNRYKRLRALSDTFYWSDSDTSSESSMLTAIDSPSLEHSNEMSIASSTNANGAGAYMVEIASEKRMTYQHINETYNNETLVNGIMTRRRKRLATQSTSRQKKIATMQRRLGWLRNHVDNGDIFFVNQKQVATGDDSIGMLVEIENQSTSNDHGFQIVDHIDITDDDSNDSINAKPFIDQFNFEFAFPHMDFSPPQLNGNEIVRIETVDIQYLQESMNDSMEIFLRQINA